MTDAIFYLSRKTAPAALRTLFPLSRIMSMCRIGRHFSCNDNIRCTYSPYSPLKALPFIVFKCMNT